MVKPAGMSLEGTRQNTDPEATGKSPSRAVKDLKAIERSLGKQFIERSG